jgi:hypothetical protein
MTACPAVSSANLTLLGESAFPAAAYAPSVTMETMAGVAPRKATSTARNRAADCTRPSSPSRSDLTCQSQSSRGRGQAASSLG